MPEYVCADCTKPLAAGQIPMYRNSIHPAYGIAPDVLCVDCFAQ